MIPPIKTGANSFCGMLAISESIVEIHIFEAMMESAKDPTACMLRFVTCWFRASGCTDRGDRWNALTPFLTNAALDDEKSAQRNTEISVFDITTVLYLGC